MASGRVIFEPVIFEPIVNPLERFQQECVANLMECALTADSAASARQLSKVLQSLPEGETFVQDDPSLRRLIELAAPARAIRWSSQGAPGEASQATVTLAEALIAQTGSILVTASCGGRGASVIAPCHIVYATVAQLVPDLATALSRVSQERKLDQQLVRVRHQRLQPHGRYRKNSGAGRAWTAKASGHLADRDLV